MLKEIQTKFLHAFYEKEKQKDFFTTIQETQQFKAAERFEIYQSSIVAGRARALQETYPVCKKLVGEEFFLAMAYEFSESRSSYSFSLNDYGEHFADFVEQFAPAKNLIYLSDVCRLEWLWQKAYYNIAACEEVSDNENDFTLLSQFSEQQQNNIVFRLPKSAYLFKSNYPVDRIWSANQDDHENDQSVDLLERGAALFVWRKELNVQIDVLHEEQWQILNAIHRGMKLGDLCLSFPKNISEQLTQIIQAGWINGFVVSR